MNAGADILAADLAESIKHAQRSKADFPAFIFQALREDGSKHILSLLPPLDAYRPITHVDSVLITGPTRYILPMDNMLCYGWAKVLNDALCSKEVADAIFRKLGILSLTLNPRVAFIRDLPGYSIRIHPDTPRKVAVCQIYLAADILHPHLGCKFYRQTGEERFEKTDQVAYLPGTGYFFEVSSKSWHGVDRTSIRDGERNSIMLVYYADSKERGYE